MKFSNWGSSQGRLLWRTLSLFAATALLSSLFAQTNLIYNPDFELGNEGFYTTYTFNPIANRSGPHSALAPGQYLLTSNPANHHPDAHSYGDFTSGEGLMLMAKGAAAPDKIVWQQPIAVEPGLTYAFTGWVAVWTPASPPALRLTANDDVLGVFTFPETPRPGAWYNWYYEWQGDGREEAVLSIVDANTSATGNGFTIDSLEFYVVPEPSSLLWMTAGISGLALRRRFTTRV